MSLASSATPAPPITEAQITHSCLFAMPHDRAPFLAAVTRQLGTARRYGMQPAVLVIAVDSAGDQFAPGSALQQDLMQLMREPLQRHLRRADLLLQIDANRFGVLLADALPTAVAGICARLERPSDWPTQVLGCPLSLRVRAGASTTPGGSSTWMEAADLLNAAEQALRARTS